jgi:acetyl-CoA carboxylase carboxyltransferase component
LRELRGHAEKAARVRALEARIDEGPGEGAIARRRARGRHTGRERVEMLLDPGSFVELDKFSGALRGVYRGNTLTGHGRVDGRPVVVVSNLGESKAGAWYGESVAKILRAQEFSRRRGLPFVLLVDSASAYLPEQDEVHSGPRHGGHIFYHLANNSGRFPQVAAVFGRSVAGGAYVPGLCDFVPMVRGQGAMFLAGPKLVRAAVGEDVGAEELGGARVHCRQSGVGDLECDDEPACAAAVRRYLSYLPTNADGAPPRLEPDDDPARPTPEVASLVAADPRQAYDVRPVLAAVFDRDSLFELRPHYGASIVVAFGRLGGRSVGAVASQPRHLGGVIDAAAADKAAWFVSLCDAFNVPLTFFQDTPGFLVGSRAERGGIIHAGARLIQAMARARVPRLTVILRKAYGAGQYALCGPGFEPARVFGLPTAETGTMAPEQLAEVVYAEAVAAAPAAARAAVERERDEVVARHRVALGADYAASKGWYDAIVYPEALRATLAGEIALVADHWAPRPPDGHRPVALT